MMKISSIQFLFFLSIFPILLWSESSDDHFDFVQEGFAVDKIYSIPKTQGSWVCITSDPKGRLIASDQSGHLYRISISNKNQTVVEKLKMDFGYAQGMVFVENDLFAVVNQSKHQTDAAAKFTQRPNGLYRLRDTNQDDHFDEITLLQELLGQGEHGPHGVVASPDKKSLYVVWGNFTRPKTIPLKSSPLILPFKEDNLFPSIKDPRGHAHNVQLPAGSIAKTDLQGSRWDFISAGYRNAYDLAINDEGDLFTYDSDMEWDMGMPWYRPTRIVHAVSGSDYGWRTGSGKWPDWYIDSLPPVINMGPGSPTGLAFGRGAYNFPKKYQNALFALDWTYGTIYAIHLEKHGASYKATKESFIYSLPLPVTDITTAMDGNMYFLTGGRKTGSHLFRISYKNPIAKELDKSETVKTKLQDLRKHLESFHGQRMPNAIDQAWPHLNHSDRFIRHAARVAIEHQPYKLWKEKAFTELEPQAAFNALTLIARKANPEDKNEALLQLLRFKPSQIEKNLQLDWMRSLQLLIKRLGEPDPSENLKLIQSIRDLYPSQDYRVNREARALLVFLKDPFITEELVELLYQDSENKIEKIDPDFLNRGRNYGKVIQEILEKPPETEKIHYALLLRFAETGWTTELRNRFFTWTRTHIKSDIAGGKSFKPYLEQIEKLALVRIEDELEKSQIYELFSKIEEKIVRKEMELPKAKGPGRSWTVESVEQLADNKLKNRDLTNGAKMYKAALCSQCHRFSGEGGDIGPDLTLAGGKFSLRDLARSIIHPSEVISDQYENSTIHLHSGHTYFGRILKSDKKQIEFRENPYLEATTVVKRKKIKSIEASSYSPMPPSLINMLNSDELLDLLAYLTSMGRSSSNPLLGSNH